jgi:hypothetical protein
MHKLTKISIALLCLVVAISTGAFIYGRSTGIRNIGISKIVNLSSDSSISSKSAVAGLSSSLSSNLASSSSAPSSQNSLVQTISKSNTENQPIQDIENVTKLSTDTSIYHQYIKDYLACPTKFYQQYNGFYKYEGDQDYKYLCIPKSQIDECSVAADTTGIVYGLKSLVGQNLTTTDPIFKEKYKFENPTSKVETGKFYCGQFVGEGLTSVTIPSIYYNSYLPDNRETAVKNYFTVIKITLPKTMDKSQDIMKIIKSISFVAIPESSYSEKDREFINSNYKIN